ncbi:tetratricopeptide repeat protein [Falsibacillus albus]|uniref:Tetratricopeptide repeat protein n=1 Tax=Falsibacillus albus TaxID=2478915 RepID=A0A3L7K2W3_9BACI|nr:tetratricopeptide repeat protein [Falsibacillus albus]RLQ96689.1 tetratricopeptide repeat protein [Falsibacillus albus]
MRKDSKARKEKSKILNFIPTGEYYFNKGIKAYHRRDLPLSKKYLLRAVQLEPQEPMILCQLAMVCTEIGEYQESNELLHKIIDELDPDMTECHYFLANNYAHIGFFKEAYKHASIYIEDDIDGEFMEDAEDLIELISLDAEEVIDSLSEQDELILKQEEARDLLEKGNFQKAVELLQDIVKNYPEFWSAYNNLALAYFYLGEMEKTADVLEEVLEKSPGNLHALCNLAVFLFYQKRKRDLENILDGLFKVKPMLQEHQYKLGATFALIGKYEESYYWLKKLQKIGFDGDPGFYYWLSQSAYQMGHMKTAKQAWEVVLEFNPEKEGLEPWNEDRQDEVGYENHLSSLLKKLGSKYPEERWFGLFLLSVSEKKAAILSHEDFPSLDKFSEAEQQYASAIMASEKNNQPIRIPDRISAGHETAMVLFQRYQPIGPVESGLFLMWFSVVQAMLEKDAFAPNVNAFAAGIEYLWYKLRHEKKSQKELAEMNCISISTLRKYVKMLEDFLR